MKAINRYILRRHAAPFGFAVAALTSLMLLNQILKRLPGLLDNGASARVIIEVFLFSVPFIVVMTVPLAVLIAVLRVFSRLSRDKEIAAASPVPGAARLIAPVLGAAICLGVLTFLWSDQILPRSNHRLRILLVETVTNPSALPTNELGTSDREMPVKELRQSARSAHQDADNAAFQGRRLDADAARRRGASYEVEIQKKYALAAACVVFVILGAPIALRFQGRGVGLPTGMSLVVFAIHYVGLIGGEDLGDRLIISPFFAMWSTNLLFVAIGLVAMWRIPRLTAAPTDGTGESPNTRTPGVRSGKYFARLWRGHLPLDVTYWIWGILGKLLLVNITMQILAGILGLVLVSTVIGVAYQAFIVVAVWRSSARYDGRRIWRILARASVVLSTIGTMMALLTPHLLDGIL